MSIEEILGRMGKLTDERGVFYGIKQIDGKPRVSSTPYTYDISEGNVPNHKSFFVLGYNGDVGTAEEDMWEVGGSYVFPTAEMGMEIVSSDDTQDKAGGTGALTIRLHYLDGAFNCFQIDGTLNGTTPVALGVTNIYRVIDFHVMTTGTGLKPVGNLDLTHLADTPIYARIAAGYNSNRGAIMTVPCDQTMYMTSLYVSSGGTAKPVKFTLRANYISHSKLIVGFFLPFAEIQCTDSQSLIPFNFPLRFPIGVDVKVSVKGGAVSGLASCAMRGWYENG